MFRRQGVPGTQFFLSSINRIQKLLYPAFLLFPFAFNSAEAASVPVGFVDKQVASGLTSPTAMTTLPDGRVLVVQQNGVIRVVKNDTLLTTNFYTIQNVDSYSERGCLGIVADPNFLSNGHVYIFCTVRNGSNSNNRILRVTANGDTAPASSERTILNLPNVPEGTRWHMGGAMRFGPDGKLYIAVGNHEDLKPMDSFAQNLSVPFGKMLRINPDGSIPSDNPYVGTSGAYRANYNLGLRNPFSFDIQPGTGLMFINDVGSGAAEEVNRGMAGANYGWPFTEGAADDRRYTNPLHSYRHGADSAGNFRCAITGAAFYNPSTPQFPGTYIGKFFYADFCSGAIYFINPSDPEQATIFATGIGNPVNLGVGLDGSLYYLARNQNTDSAPANSGTMGKIEYTGTRAPRISQHPQSQTIYIGDPVTFSVSANDATSIQWQRNGVNIPGATTATYRLNSTTMADNQAAYTAALQNSHGTTISSPAVLTITTNRLPVANIIRPVAGNGFLAGEKLDYSGSGTDAEDGSLPASAFSWKIDFHHDTHSHPFMAATSGAQGGSMTVPDFEGSAANIWLRFILSVKDSANQIHTVTRDVYPRHQLSALIPSAKPLNGLGPLEANRHNGNAVDKDGGEMSLGRIPYQTGLGVHAPSDVKYNIGGSCAGNLIADVGLDDSVGNGGSVIFQVFLDGQKAFDSGLMRGGEPRKSINLDVAGKKELRLVVTDGGDGNNSDRANWAGARVTCSSLPEQTLKAGGSGAKISPPSGGGGCSIGGNGRFDPTLLGLAIGAFGLLVWRRRKKST